MSYDQVQPPAVDEIDRLEAALAEAQQKLSIALAAFMKLEATVATQAEELDAAEKVCETAAEYHPSCHSEITWPCSICEALTDWRRTKDA